MKRTTTLLLALILGACGQQADDAEPAEQAMPAEPEVSIYETAVAHAERPDTDRVRDAGRKPADVLERDPA